MLTYILASLAMVLCSVLGYSLGYDKGTNDGIDQVLNEDLIRLDRCDPCQDRELSHVVDSLYSSIETYEERYAEVKAIVDSIPEVD